MATSRPSNGGKMHSCPQFVFDDTMYARVFGVSALRDNNGYTVVENGVPERFEFDNLLNPARAQLKTMLANQSGNMLVSISSRLLVRLVAEGFFYLHELESWRWQSQRLSITAVRKNMVIVFLTADSTVGMTIRSTTIVR